MIFQWSTHPRQAAAVQHTCVPDSDSEIEADPSALTEPLHATHEAVAASNGTFSLRADEHTGAARTNENIHKL